MGWLSRAPQDLLKSVELEARGGGGGGGSGGRAGERFCLAGRSSHKILWRRGGTFLKRIECTVPLSA